MKGYMYEGFEKPCREQFLVLQCTNWGWGRRAEGQSVSESVDAGWRGWQF